MGYPYFNPPHIQKANTIEQGNYFVPTKGVEEQELSRELYVRTTKAKKIVKTVALVLGIAAFLWLATVVLKDYYTLGVY